MKRKIIGAAAAYMSGLFFASFFSDIYGLLMLCGVILAAVAGGMKRRFTKGDCVMLAVCFAAAFGVSTAYTRLTYDRITAYGGTSGTFSGRITDFDTYDRDYAEYTLNGTINGDIKAKIRLRTNELDASYGDIVTVDSCKFTVPQNTYIFPSADRYRAMHIYLTASGEEIAVQRTNSGLIRRALVDLRETSTNRFLTTLGREQGGVLAGMVFGEKDHIDSSVKTSLYRTGIGHILAVSGLHVSIIAAALMALLRKLKVNKYLSFAIVNVMLVLLIIMANSPVSAIRAALMLDIMYSAGLFRQQNDSFNSLAIAALIICIADPYCVLSSSFVLSLSGTFGIAVLGPFVTAKLTSDTLLQKLRNSAVIAVCTTIAVFPASVYFFDEVSVISPIANLLLVPLCSGAMLIGVIDVVTCGLLPVLPAAGALISAVIGVSDGISAFGGAFISTAGDALPSLLVTGALIAAAVYFLTGNRRKTLITAAAALVICAAANTYLYFDRSGKCVVSVLGRDTDAAVVISYRGRSEIIDLSGSPYTDEYVRKYISANGCAPEKLILTENADPRYSAYLKSLGSYDIGEILTPEIHGGSFEHDLGGCTVSYSGGAAEISFGGSDITLARAGAVPETDIVVYYGKLPKNEPVYENCIYLSDCGTELSGINDFEIILSADGQYVIRRL